MLSKNNLSIKIKAEKSALRKLNDLTKSHYLTQNNPPKKCVKAA